MPHPFDPAASPAHRVLADVLARRAGLTADAFSFAIRTYDRPLRGTVAQGFTAGAMMAHRERAPRYPASVMKLFVLSALAAARADGTIEYDPEDDRAARAMIAVSSNEATVYLIGRLTGAEDGAPLYGPDLEDWIARRQTLQTFFARQERPEYAGINILHGTYEDSPYGRAFQARDDRNGNRLTALAGAALLHDVMRGVPPGAAWMQGLLSRDFQRSGGPHEGDQIKGYLGEGLPDDVALWSKAGHTSWTRHDLLYGERPDGAAFLISIMSDSRISAADDRLLPEFAAGFYRTVFG